VKTLKQFSWRDAANSLFVIGVMPLLLLAALRGELAQRLEPEQESRDRI
jgi:hypothetical protein